MKNITHLFDDLYVPQKAVIIYANQCNDKQDVYVEAYDMDTNGCPINGRPLDTEECAGLAKALDSSEELRRDFLKPKGLLPAGILHLNPSHDGFALWYSKEQEADLFFTDGLSIPCGKAKIPALLWKANRTQLSVYALKTSKQPTEGTPLYHAPFFNIHENGSVCMGTVDVDIDNATFLEDFISRWQQYFLGSYFSHLIGGHSPVNGNIVQLWKGQVGTARNFPTNSLIKHHLTIKDLIR